jgi:hypothetical protein
MATNVRTSKIQSIFPGFRVLEVHHTATTHATANTATTETITLDKSYENIKFLGLSAGCVGDTPEGVVSASFVENTDAGISGVTVKVAISSQGTAEPVAVRLMLLVKEA